MAEVLKHWLRERLQRPITWEAKEFGDMMKNGYVIANVLLSYNVINEDKFLLMRSSKIKEDVINNWKLLTGWFQEIDVELPETELTNVMNGVGASLLRLFYQLYLKLDKKDRTDFIIKEMKKAAEHEEKMKHRFNVEKVEVIEDPIMEGLSKFLRNEKHLLEWRRKKEAEVKETHDYMRHRFHKMVDKMREEQNIPTQSTSKPKPKPRNKEKKDMDKFSLLHPCTFENYTYEELQELGEKAMKEKQTFKDSEWARQYLDNLYTKMHDKSATEEFQRQLCIELSTTMWDETLEEEEKKWDTKLAQSVMQLTHFEKQMCTQIMETKQQAQNLIDDRIRAEKEFDEERNRQFNQFFDSVKGQIEAEALEVDFEKSRQQMLHKKLYEEKMARKRQEYNKICYETIISILDYATKYSDFRALIGDEVPDHFIHEWKTLYFKQQAIFDILDPMEDILNEHLGEEGLLPEVEEIIRLELDRQEVLNDSEFQEYHNYTDPWNLEFLIPNYDPESEERKFEYLGTRVLGHVAYTLLEIKYPYPPPRPPADLPSFQVKALLRGLPDKSLTIPIQTLLRLRKIYVARLETAVNFCLRQFKTEMIGCTDIDLNYDKFSVAAPEDFKEFIKTMKADDDATSKYNESVAASVILGPSLPNAKQTQTPKTLPESEMVLSTAAELGKYAYASLSFGEPLTDHLIAAMLVELIKDQGNVNGFVIINYPNTYREAKILEETFSGNEPPDERELDDRDDIYLEESIMRHQKKERDEFKDVRTSRLVVNPHNREDGTSFASYFSTYIKLKLCEDILQELVIWDLNEENSNLIDRFYAALGINYSMYYEVMDKDFLAQLCTYIIGDILPEKSCDSLFGENVLSELEFPSNDDRRMKSKVVKPEVSGKKSKERLQRGSKTSKSSLSDSEMPKRTSDDRRSSEELNDETLTEEIEEEHLTAKSSVSSVELVVLAGEEEWVYGKLPISEPIGTALASCWEEIERVYIHDLTELFFSKRLQINCLAPYTRFIRDKMDQIITMPSPKQDLVSQFQKEYNDFEIDWRNIIMTKYEFHCRIKDLQNQLYNICDDRKQAAEKQRRAIITDNWISEELITLANTYISCMQTELNRFYLTLQGLHDFYFAMLKQMPPSDRHCSKELIKISREEDPASGKKGEDKLYKQLKASFYDMQLNDILIDFSNNPLNSVIENNVKTAMKLVKEANDSYRTLISKEYSEFAKPAADNVRLDGSATLLTEEDIKRLNALKCIDEWIMAVNGEMFRVNLRLIVLQYKCYQDMKLFNDYIYKSLTEVQDYINSHYLKEIESVERLCQFLHMAVENARKVPETLFVEHESFTIDPNLLQYLSVEQVLETDPTTEVVTECEFKISQLAKLRSQFKMIAPTGIALHQAFIYILQDFSYFGKENTEGSILPEIWDRMDPENIPKLVHLLFGDTVYIDWRDFLIYCLGIRFPNIEELLELRRNLRCSDLQSTELISRNDFLNIKFWFDGDFNPDDRRWKLRKMLIKHFLFELFEVQEDLMNYPAMLLALCKHANPLEGFASALAMAVGKKVCFNYDECEEIVQKLINDKKYREECIACAHSCADRFLEKLLDEVINNCEGITITEVKFKEPEEKNRKKSKGPSSKDKKKEGTQSARLPRTSKSLSDKSVLKMAQSTSAMKTFICPPCEKEDSKKEQVTVIKEKPPAKPERKPEPQPDPNVAYAVSQATLWNVLKVCLPWHFDLIPDQAVTPYMEQVYTAMKSLEELADDGDIYVSRFLADTNVSEILHKVKKFTVLDFVEQIRNTI